MIPVTLRPEQQLAVDKSLEFLRTAQAGAKLPWTSPTGTGKTYVALAIKNRAKSELGLIGYVVAPNDDILAGFATKDGVLPDGKGGTYSKPLLESHGFYTPVALRNRLASGTIKPPDFLIPDESHHWEAETGKLLDLLTSVVPCIGLSASFFRGTPKSTAELHKKWGQANPIITMQDAVAKGYMQFPECRIIPLLDDDVIEVRNGEFVIQDLERQLTDVRKRLVYEVGLLYSPAGYDKPTMLSLPSVMLAEMYTDELNNAGLPAVCITGETKAADRQKRFRQCLAKSHALVQIRVVSEGVDFPFRRLIDLSPTLSPVLWLQQFGRITRPGDDPPEYICTNRNLLRHAYLLEGLLPPAVYKSGEELFGKPSERRTVRALGFEGLGKFKVDDIPLHNGTTGQLVCISAVNGNIVTEYAAIASPLHPEVLYAVRCNERRLDSDTVYTNWVQIGGIPNLDQGYASVGKGSLSDKQKAWWKRSARWYGLDETAIPNRRQFVALPVLFNTGFRFR